MLTVGRYSNTRDVRCVALKHREMLPIFSIPHLPTIVRMQRTHLIQLGINDWCHSDQTVKWYAVMSKLNCALALAANKPLQMYT